jgi:hypothetical protein
MTSESMTISHLFAGRVQKLSEQQQSIVEAGKAASALKQRVLEDVSALPWPEILHTALDRLDALLDIGLSDILAGAWKKCVALQEYADPAKHPPEEVCMLPLTEHVLKSEHHPYLEVLLGEQALGRIDFDLVLMLTLKGVVLRIQDGRIKGIAAGQCKGEGRLACEGVELLKEGVSFELPGTIDLGEGLQIAV